MEQTRSIAGNSIGSCAHQRPGAWFCLGLSVFTFLLPFAPRVHADVVSAQGRTIAVDVQITALRDGQLSYRTSTGQNISRPIEQIRYLQVAGWESLNQAEKQRRDGHDAAALESYEKSLEENKPATSESGLNRGLLLQCRLVGFYDAQGRFDSAVASYLAVLESMPACVDSLRPQHVPRDDLIALKAAAERVEEAVARRDRLDTVGNSLEKWRATWPVVKTDGAPKTGTRPDKTGTPPRPDSQPSDAVWGPVLARVKTSLEKREFQQAIDLVNAERQKAAGPLPAELYYVQGRAYLEMAGKKAEDAAANRRRAGLAFLRVVILSPESPAAAECLFRAAEICRDEGKTDRSVALLTELIQTRPNAAPWSQRAREMLAGLRSPASAPAR